MVEIQRAYETAPEDSNKIKKVKSSLENIRKTLKELDTQSLMLMQAEIFNELTNRYNKEGGINPNSEEPEEKKIERARYTLCKDNGLTYKERVDRYHGFPA